MRLPKLAATAATTLLLLGGFIASCSQAPRPVSKPPDSNNQSTSASSTPPPPPPPGPAAAPTKPAIPEPASPERHKRMAARPPNRAAPDAAPPPPGDDQLIESEISKLKKGNLAYSTPQQMTTGKTAHVVARIAPISVSIEALKSNLPTDQNQKVATASTPISTRMKMSLRSADFDITPLSSEEQIVAGDTATQWEWDIVPKHSGDLRLHLAAVVELNGLTRDFTTVDRDIIVKVDPVDAARKFVGTNWQWIIATLTALTGAVWKYLSARKNKAATA